MFINGGFSVGKYYGYGISYLEIELLTSVVEQKDPTNGMMIIKNGLQLDTITSAYSIRTFQDFSWSDPKNTGKLEESNSLMVIN